MGFFWWGDWGKKKKKDALEYWKTWKKFLEAFYASKMPSAANLSPDFCETEFSSQDFLLPLGQLVHFSSSVTVLPAVLWVLSCMLLGVKQSPAECTWLTVCCHTKSATSPSSHSGSLTGHLHSWSPFNLFTSLFPPDFPLWVDMPSVK